MGRSKEAWLDGPSDLQEDVVQDVPRPGESVKVRGLSASYSNQASSEALVFKQVGREQISTVDTAKMEVLQFHHGVIEPVFTLKESEAISEKYGPAFKKVIKRIDELSGVNKEAFDEASARFPQQRTEPAGSTLAPEPPVGSNGSDVPARAGARTGNAG